MALTPRHTDRGILVQERRPVTLSSLSRSTGNTPAFPAVVEHRSLAYKRLDLEHPPCTTTRLFSAPAEWAAQRCTISPCAACRSWGSIAFRPATTAAAPAAR